MPSGLQPWRQKTCRCPSLHSWSAARDTAWGKALLHSDAKTPRSMSSKSQVALSSLSLRVLSPHPPKLRHSQRSQGKKILTVQEAPLG